jgi:NAD(P)-dependent dehydrogenase (short-subunit alcohol dehydrogenase family)
VNAAGRDGNRVVIVTGGASGIGRACVERFAREPDCTVYAADLQAPKPALDSAGNIRALDLDITDIAGMEATFAGIAAEHGGIDGFVHCAGIKGERTPVAAYPLERWNSVIQTNLSGTFFALRAVIPHLVRTQGAAVTLASTLGLVGARHSAAYVAAKHGVVGLTKAAALDYADHGVRINAIAPGHTDTPFLQIASGTDSLDGILAKHPMGRLGAPGEIAELAYFLISPAASFTTGSVFSADGGYTSQ